ncbi:glycosyltransferase [Halobacteriovorax sp. HLS]|uniref:glycosyltransferase n=1 Tax=Halobacteriovorax sp. HLS TaxID=2234000 RepID=UPI000FDC484E|nr:glycosyltransferase [Halobacteriovorax sp. HLS]
MANIFKDQQNILYVCLGMTWGTRERMAIKDCLISREIGHNVFLYCLRDSIIHMKAKALGIDCLFHSAAISLNFFKWYRLNDFVNYLTKFDIRLVHCYDLKFLWPASFYLKRKHLVPLVFTFNHEIKKYYKKYWYKNLIQRIDQVFLPIKEMSDSVHDHMNIPLRKFEYTGIGVKSKECPESDQKSTGSWFVGCAVGGHEVSSEFLEPIISAVNSINAKGTLTKKVKLIIYSEVSWSKFLIHKNVKKFINTIGATEHIFLETTDKLSSACFNVDAWVGLNVREPMEDLLLCSALNSRPFLAPRKYAIMEFFRKYGVLGEAYKTSDTRELRDKLERMLLNYERYTTNLVAQKEQLETEFGYEFYKNQLLMGYEKTITKRERLFRKKTQKRL